MRRRAGAQVYAAGPSAPRLWASFELDPTKITCPFMSLYGANELGDEAIRQVHEFDRLLGSTIKVKRATTRLEGAEAHCQLNNYGLQHQVSYDFLDEVLGVEDQLRSEGENDRAARRQRSGVV